MENKSKINQASTKKDVEMVETNEGNAQTNRANKKAFKKKKKLAKKKGK